MRRKPNQFGALFAGLVAIAGSIAIRGEDVIAPNSSSAEPGPGVINAFSPGNFSRLLTIYNASEFLGAMPDGGYITAIAYRIDEQDRSTFSATLSDLEIRLSTSPSLAPELPLPFSANVGGDETIVFPRGSVEFIAEPSNSGVNPFSLKVPLRDPFFYNPAHGSLAVDLLNYGSASATVLLDAATDNALSVQGNLGDSAGLRLAAAPVLQITFTAVPEPPGLVLAGLGAFLLLGRWRIHRRA